MRFLPVSIVLFLAITSTSVTGFQPFPPGGGPPPPPPEEAVPYWAFTHPEDGMECYSDVVFIGTGPRDSLGLLSVYSYDNQFPQGVYPGELDLQVSAVVSTDPGVDWVGPTWTQQGTYCATVMPANESLNMATLSLDSPGATGADVYTLTQVGDGECVLFSIVNPW